MLNKLILDTRSIDKIYSSLSKILHTTEGEIEYFVKNVNVQPIQYSNELKKYFNLNDEFYLPYVTMHHFTSRLYYNYESNFKIDTLDNIIINESPLTKFFKENKLEFKKEYNRINVYYKGELVLFDNEDLHPNFRYYRGLQANNRLKLLQDTCINGFLFNELPDNYYYLKDIPEIFEFILSYIGDTDIKKKYIENSIGLSATIIVNIKDLILDNSPNLDLKSEKTSIILEYIIDYLKYYHNGCYSNPIIRLNDYKSVSKDEILSLKKIREDK